MKNMNSTTNTAGVTPGTYQGYWSSNLLSFPIVAGGAETEVDTGVGIRGCVEVLVTVTQDAITWTEA